VLCAQFYVVLFVSTDGFTERFLSFKILYRKTSRQFLLYFVMYQIYIIEKASAIIAFYFQISIFCWILIIYKIRFMQYLYKLLLRRKSTTTKKLSKSKQQQMADIRGKFLLDHSIQPSTNVGIKCEPSTQSPYCGEHCTTCDKLLSLSSLAMTDLADTPLSPMSTAAEFSPTTTTSIRSVTRPVWTPITTDLYDMRYLHSDAFA